MGRSINKFQFYKIQYMIPRNKELSNLEAGAIIPYQKFPKITKSSKLKTNNQIEYHINLKEKPWKPHLLT